MRGAGGKGDVMRMSFVAKGACLLAAVSFLAVPPVKGAAASIPPEPPAEAKDSSARLAFFSLRTCEPSEDAAAAVRELTTLVKGIAAATQRYNPGARFPSPVPPVLVRNPFLSTAP